MHPAAEALVTAGTVIIIAACLGALSARSTYVRLHYLAPITSLGGPLLALGLSVDSGINLTTASILLPTALLFFSGPILNAAMGRATLQRDRPSQSESPD